MTLAQCLEEIRVTCLNGNTQQMSNIAKNLIGELKYKYYREKEYPRNGWFISLGGKGDSEVSLFNKDFVIPMKIPRSEKQVVSLKRYQFN